MTEPKKIIRKDSKVQDDISQIIGQNKEESYATQSKIGKNALLPSNVFEHGNEIMGETIEDMDMELD